MAPQADSKLPPAIAIAATIRSIPRGKVSTYGAVAVAAGFPRLAREVGRVLRTVRGLPWQRVLGSGGRIVTPGEYALEQRFLLEAEGVRFKGRKVDMAVCEFRFPKAKKSRKTAGSPVKIPLKSYRRTSD
jgi:methylated-DNA-protein-cysteine methyltransferase-like protein